MASTELVYLVDSYVREFGAVVVASEGGYVALDRTCFYPGGGGQPYDTGVILFGGKSLPVSEVFRRGRLVWHFVGESVPVGVEVVGRIDWGRRYAHMRYHTAQHMLSALFLGKLGARTTGNQIHADRAHMNFDLEKIDRESLLDIEEEANRWIKRDVEVKTYFLPRGEALRLLDPRRTKIDRLPTDVEKLRIVEISGLDLCACGGTHVKRTGELGRLRIVKVKSKGRAKKRVEFVLEW